MSSPLQIRFGKDDKDLADYFDSLEKGTKAEQAKTLIRLGLVVHGMDLLNLLLKKGIVDPVHIAAAAQHSPKSVSKDAEALFLQNMSKSWQD